MSWDGIVYFIKPLGEVLNSFIRSSSKIVVFSKNLNWVGYVSPFP